MSTFLFFFGRGRGFASPTARSFWGSSYERSGLKLDRAMVANVVKLKLSGCVSAAARQIFKFAFLGCGSRRLKFINLTSNLKVKRQGEVFYRNILLRKNAMLVLRWI